MNKDVQEMIDAGYHYFVCSIHGDYVNSGWTTKKAAEAAIQDIYVRPNRNLFTPLTIVTDKDL